MLPFFRPNETQSESTKLMTRDSNFSLSAYASWLVQRDGSHSEIGKIDLPDANNDIQWFKKDGPNNTALTADKNLNIHVQKITRDDGITLGMYLMINKVEEGDFGDYICSASNTGDQITERTSQLIRIGHALNQLMVSLSQKS
ncbi:hypothetical protein ACFE04_011135 [Oxalis oulophora]